MESFNDADGKLSTRSLSSCECEKIYFKLTLDIEIDGRIDRTYLHREEILHKLRGVRNRRKK